MRYTVNLDANPASVPVLVDVSERPDGGLDVQVAGRAVDVDVVATRDALSVRVDGQMMDLMLDGAPPECGAVAHGIRANVRVESARQQAANASGKRGGAAAAGAKGVKSPMPGRVIQILVRVGDAVAPGQSLCVVEAMKMENEVKARAAGIVAEIHVAVGATVEGNAKLLTLA